MTEQPDAYNRFLTAYGADGTLTMTEFGSDPTVLGADRAYTDDHLAETLVPKLDAFLPGTVLLDKDGDAWQKQRTGRWNGAFPEDADEPNYSLDVAKYAPLRIIHLP